MVKTETHKALNVHFFKSQASILRWLAANHDQDHAIWIKLAKKASGIQSISYEQAREAAIMYGWIDGLMNGYDERYYLIRFCKRRPRSKWSRINRGIAQQLIETGRIQPSGLEQVHAAQQDGRWDAAYASSATIEVPAELQQRLEENRKAKAFFDSLDRANRFAFLYRIQNAARESTRRKHLDKTMEMLISGQTYHPPRKKK